MQRIDEVDKEKLIALEMERHMQSKVPNVSSEESMNEQEIYKALAAPFPKEAYSKDTSRGFALTSLKAQYVRERLNEVLGIMNWTFGGEYKETEDGGVLFLGALIVNINGRQNKFFAPGYAAKKKNLGDSYKSANTDSLCKCASNIGVGNDAFKGNVDPETFELVVGGAKPKAAKKTTTKKTTKKVAKSTTTETTDAPAGFTARRKKKTTTKKSDIGI